MELISIQNLVRVENTLGEDRVIFGYSNLLLIECIFFLSKYVYVY